ncbi:FecR domain-containing protein [Asticcacaulis sp. BYS171W]|uniref:FecR domain-containing protein n=1 Tax=Asticcacaulis aquaticus TaxID=2984212 RepID=A0ABT5HZ05_9CAUL|nr:FecR domain-containing protein [Asticcacaulis aquaticus]MDC7684666.1 FecR domain-containing protein [Asticcacaulis aquaticus]
MRREDGPETASLDPEARARLVAEAAVWMARLKTDNRLEATEAGFKAWLMSAPEAQSLFDEATDVWEKLPVAARASRPMRRGALVRRGVVAAMAASVCLAFGFGAYSIITRPVVYETQKGEQRVVTLADASQITLNTDTRLSVRYTGGARGIVMQRGEAIFSVAHDAARPFTVDAKGQRVTALGTRFVVRNEPTVVEVTLLTGKVDVRAISDEAQTHKSIVLTSGDRVMIRDGMDAVTDRPVPQVVTAWQRQEIVFTDSTLSEAVRELNRYSRIQLIVSDPRVAGLKVAGVFQTGNPAAFAQSMARIYGLKLRYSPDVIELSR